MDILSDKYLPPDTVRDIAYQTPADTIISFCQTNQLTSQICKPIDFWVNYISGNQRKYNKLLLSIAENGDLDLFKRIWTNKHFNVISEPKILSSALRKRILMVMKK